MTTDTIRAIASDASVISAALLALTFVLIATVYKGFERRFVSLNNKERRTLVNTCFLSIIPVLLAMTTITLVGIYDPSDVQASPFLVFIELIVIFVIYLIGNGVRNLIYFIKRKKKPSQEKIRIDEPTILYFLSLLLVCVSIMCFLGAMVSTISFAMDISFGPYSNENFNAARWLMGDGVTLFASSVLGTGFSYLYDRSRLWKKPLPSINNIQNEGERMLTNKLTSEIDLNKYNRYRVVIKDKKIISLEFNSQKIDNFVAPDNEDKLPKLYIIKSGSEIVYVGQTTQNLKTRLTRFSSKWRNWVLRVYVERPT